ncbi:rCG36866, isoform CRA_a [Rattus norvegicus]|uniref:RCG36866, isoform CRA_a n=1 Tax=Rattus norvegicus TaxID=10116 RepID=A6HU26_RAT|nr:rCG36866, isoform CRA_a [Rattus norvegicus]EDM02388.1 rCG36866, isoform CRA_a [Rattus norvegicus]
MWNPAYSFQRAEISNWKLKQLEFLPGSNQLESSLLSKKSEILHQ